MKRSELGALWIILSILNCCLQRRHPQPASADRKPLEMSDEGAPSPSAFKATSTTIAFPPSASSLDRARSPCHCANPRASRREKLSCCPRNSSTSCTASPPLLAPANNTLFSRHCSSSISCGQAAARLRPSRARLLTRLQRSASLWARPDGLGTAPARRAGEPEDQPKSHNAQSKSPQGATDQEKMQFEIIRTSAAVHVSRVERRKLREQARGAFEAKRRRRKLPVHGRSIEGAGKLAQQPIVEPAPLPPPAHARHVGLLLGLETKPRFWVRGPQQGPLSLGGARAPLAPGLGLDICCVWGGAEVGRWRSSDTF